jgi:hypothetical protein
MLDCVASRFQPRKASDLSTLIALANRRRPHP